jgi:lactoylglutathione lyase
MIPIRDLFETHLTVSDLDRAVRFYREALGLPLAQVFPEIRAAFFWIGAPGKSMLGLWEAGRGPQKMSLHTAFTVEIEAVLDSPRALRMAGITPLDFEGNPATEPVVLAWMPAAAVYFRDPDGNLLEFLAMLEEAAAPQLGVLSWSSWQAARTANATE